MFEEAEKKNKLNGMKKHIKEVFKNYKVIQKKRDYLIEHLGNITIKKSNPIAKMEAREVKRLLRVSDESLLVFFFPIEIFEVM